MTPNLSKLPGIYIHIPFCQSKCGYCDFYSITDPSLRGEFISSLLEEIRLAGQHYISGQSFDTIYFGGGTPSLLTQHELDRILSGLFKTFSIARNCEITLEANPVSTELQNLCYFRSLGVNRLSLGVQSFSEGELLLLGRLHTSEEAVSAIQASRDAGFENISIDLIYSLPGQQISEWEETLKKAVMLHPEHISAYNLSIEEGTPFHRLLLNGAIKKNKEEDELIFFEQTVSILKDGGYQAYEISNYAVSPSRYSRHNCKYWDHTDYIGLGPSAHTFWDNMRHANVSSVSGYIRQLSKSVLPRDKSETIDTKTMEFESILLSLRTYAGLDIALFYDRFGIDFLKKYGKLAEKLIDAGFAGMDNRYFKLTGRGMAISDTIIAQFQ